MIDVLIMGANPSGLILASILKQHGARIKVIDSRDSVTSPLPLPLHTLPLVLASSSLELLDNMNLLGDLLNKGRKIFGARYHWKQRSVLFKFDQSSASRYPFSLLISYEDLVSHLLQEFEKRGGVVNWATRPVTQVEQNLFIESTKSSTQVYEGREIFAPKWIIACEMDADPDLKDLLKTQIKPKKLYKEALFVDCEEGEPFEEAHIHLLPITKNFVNFIFYNPYRGSRQLYLTNTSGPLSPKFKNKLLYTYSLALAENSLSISTTLLQYPFCHDRYIFLGSIANNLSFSYLSGVNSNIHEAFNLGWKLLPVLKKAASSQLIFSKELKTSHVLPHFNEVHQKRAVKLLFSNMYTPALMYYYLKKCRKLDIVEGELYYPSHRALKYEASDIIKVSPNDKEIRGPRPGSRALDVRLDTGDYLLDSLKNAKHLLIFFKNRNDLVSALLEEYGEWVDVIATEDPNVHKFYHANPESLFIIRPDRYIGYRTHSFKLHELISYLLRIFATEN
ncbi:FAD-dependent monooxygenase [Chlamydia sp.]|uniref:FAD-dependent monooxygenase n=1 Tax=Chlamydia sp. TaxID=35827 RepID=UPI0025C3AC70|nr:FAD-dependent monooxygenase [Chlamydia sp.]MBQ8498196.1 FAD-dependent monooxygenase [Chlamydia sp.]